MTLGDGDERSGGEPAVSSTDDSVDGSADGADTTADPAPLSSPDRPRERRRKAGVRYRPV